MCREIGFFFFFLRGDEGEEGKKLISRLFFSFARNFPPFLIAQVYNLLIIAC